MFLIVLEAINYGKELGENIREYQGAFRTHGKEEFLETEFFVGHCFWNRIRDRSVNNRRGDNHFFVAPLSATAAYMGNRINICI